MPSNPPIDQWELAGTQLWFAVSSAAYLLWGPRAGFVTAGGLVLVAAIAVAGYAHLTGWPAGR